MKIIFKKKGKKKEVLFKAKEEKELKRALAIINYEAYREEFFADLELDNIEVFIKDEKVSFKEAMKLIEKELSKKDFDNKEDKKKKKKKEKCNFVEIAPRNK